jgi:hypothetical protein
MVAAPDLACEVVSLRAENAQLRERVKTQQQLKVDAFLAEQRARADQEWSRDYDRRQQLMEQVRALA